jgi:hypothetical protein
VTVRGTIGRLQAAIAKARASLPSLVTVLEPRGDRESAEAFQARLGEARERACGRRTVIVLVDRDEEENA